MVQQPQVDLAPVRAFLAGARCRCVAPTRWGRSAAARIFSAAMFPPRPGDSRPPGYLYIVLDGAARQQVARQQPTHVWQGLAALVAGVCWRWRRRGSCCAG
jgi:hypothetical protein